MTALSVLLLEAAFVGLFTILFGSVTSIVVSQVYSAITGKQWGTLPMVLSLFLSGALLHLFFELVGLNAYYLSYKTAT